MREYQIGVRVFCDRAIICCLSQSGRWKFFYLQKGTFKLGNDTSPRPVIIWLNDVCLYTVRKSNNYRKLLDLGCDVAKGWWWVLCTWWQSLWVYFWRGTAFNRGWDLFPKWHMIYHKKGSRTRSQFHFYCGTIRTKISTKNVYNIVFDRKPEIETVWRGSERQRERRRQVRMSSPFLSPVSFPLFLVL